MSQLPHLTTGPNHGWPGLLSAACLVLAACSRIDPGPELQQAAAETERATGVQPAWTPSAQFQVLRPDESGTVTLDQALSLALANNRALRSDLEAIAQAKADLVQAGLLTNPMLSLMFRFPEAGGRASFDFGLAKDFADLWLIPSRKKAAQAMLQQRILSLTDTAIALVTEVKTSYFMLQYQAAAIALQQKNLDILRQATEIAHTRLRAGQAGQLDVNLLSSRYLEAELELLQHRSDYRLTQQTLLRLMGVADAADNWHPQAADVNALVTALRGESAPEADFVELAIQQRLDVQAAWWELQAATAELDQQRLRAIPSLGIGLLGSRMEARAQPGRSLLADTARASLAAGRLTAPEIESARQRRLERSREIDFLIGPTLEVPLPIFDQNQAQVAKAQSRARELQQRYQELEQRVTAGVRAALTTRRLAEERLRSFRDSLLPLQEANLQLAQTAYQAGRESILTVLLAQEQHVRTRLGLAAAVRDLAISEANLERQLAGRVPHFLLHPSDTQPASPPPPADPSATATTERTTP